MRSKLFVLGAALSIVAAAAGVRMAAAPAGASPTFNKDVAPIVFNSCVSCHRPNQIAPMSLMSYKEARPWARAIKDRVTKREMPPWFADPRFGHFANNPRLSDEQIKTISEWVDAGAPEGDTPLAAQVPPVNDGWSHPSGRLPDFIIEMPDAYEGKSEGELPWFNIYSELPAELKKEDHYIEAIQVLPGVVEAVHHAQWGIKPLPPGTKIGTGEAWPGGQVIKGTLIDVDTGKLASIVTKTEGVVRTVANVNPDEEGRRPANQMSYCCYVPGGSFRQYPAGGYVRIPHEGIIEWGMHYTLLGRPFADKTKVGLWWAKDLRFEVLGNAGTARSQVVQGQELVNSKETPIKTTGAAASGPMVPVIPAMTKDWAITAITAYPDDFTLYMVWPHMHLRGKEMTYVLTYPDGKEQILLSVPNFDFNWQLFYTLKEPLKIPAGSTIKTVGSYDNSPSNRWASQPQKEVYWSEQSWDEMYNGFRDYSIDKLEKKGTAASTISRR